MRRTYVEQTTTQELPRDKNVSEYINNQNLLSIAALSQRMSQRGAQSRGKIPKLADCDCEPKGPFFMG